MQEQIQATKRLHDAVKRLIETFEKLRVEDIITVATERLESESRKRK